MTVANPPAPSPRAIGEKRTILTIATGGFVIVLLLTLGWYFFLFLRPATAVPRPVVLVRSPSHGQQILVGKPVTFHAVARGESRIVRVEFWVDGELHEVQRSNFPEGVSPLPLVATWVAPTAGTHVLAARAFDVDGHRVSGEISVQAIEGNSPDGSRLGGFVDECPGEQGWASTGGCSDRDGDGVADLADNCPDDVGAAGGNGCPMVATDDRDGDGVADEADRCPDEPGIDTLGGCPMPEDGDGDEVADSRDACPGAPGTPEFDGCPDSDGDGLGDSMDACPTEAGVPESGCPTPEVRDRDGDGMEDEVDHCPDEPGPSETGGCPVPGGVAAAESDGDGVSDEGGSAESSDYPDGDGDTVCDDLDLCPTAPGLADSGRCPDTGAGDRDSDGVPDDVDLCPADEGRPESGGCPPPGDGDGITDEEGLTIPPLGPAERFALPGGGRPPVPVELQVLDFAVSADYDEITCYPSLSEGVVERYSFEPLGERRWDVGDLGSRVLAVPPSDPIELRVESGGEVSYRSSTGGWGTYYSLGSISASHPPSDWDGHVITARSTGGDEGRWFAANYRLCAGSCDRTAFPPPVLRLVGTVLFWTWEGAREQAAGYHVYMDNTRIATTEVGSTSLSVRGLEAPCGMERQFTVTAFGPDGRESPFSNRVAFESAPCPRTVRVTFESLETGYLGDDEWWADGVNVGPIYGNFWVQGTSEAVLSFSAVDYPELAGGRQNGFRLAHYHHYSVQGIFDEILRRVSGINDSVGPYSAPEHSYVDVQLGPYESLSFGGEIWNSNSGRGSAGADRRLFDGDLTLRPSDLAPGRYEVRDRNIVLTVAIDVLVGPEVGSQPDLVISDVTQHESGQLRVHLFNNAADLVNRDIKVALARASSNEQLGTMTWPNVTIPSGGSKILQWPDPPSERWDLRVTVDPDNQIAEANEGNNIRETPIVMRVEFVGVGTSDRWEWFSSRGWIYGYCNENCEDSLDDDSEHVFWLWSGHGPAGGEPVWVAAGVRYPASGQLVATVEDPQVEDWFMEGKEGYSFDFEMPVGHNLYVRAMGEEQDRITDNDSMGEVFREYGSSDNWGARSEAYAAFAGTESPCDDIGCEPCHRGLWASWRITRIH